MYLKSLAIRRHFLSRILIHQEAEKGKKERLSPDMAPWRKWKMFLPSPRAPTTLFGNFCKRRFSSWKATQLRARSQFQRTDHHRAKLARASCWRQLFTFIAPPPDLLLSFVGSKPTNFPSCVTALEFFEVACPNNRNDLLLFPTTRPQPQNFPACSRNSQFTKTGVFC